MLLQMLIIFYSMISFVGIMVIILLMKNAPLGWEDKDGFHYGKKPGANDESLKIDRIFHQCCYIRLSGNRAHIS